MNFELSDEQELLRDTVRRFLADRASITEHVRGLLGDEVGCDREVWAGLAALGCLDLVSGVAGSAPDLVGAGVVIEEAGRALLPEPYLASAVGAATALRFGDGLDRRVDLLRSLADGSRIATVAVHEPNGRYGWRAPAVRARRDGDNWRISGTKAPVLSARAADTIVVTASDELEALGLFVVDRRDGSTTTAAVESVDRSRKLGRVTFEDAPASRIGGVDAVRATQRLLDVVGLGLALDGVGAASAALELTVEYARSRRQFGVPIGSFQAVQHLCADMLRDLEMVRVGTYYALWAAQSAGDDELHRASTMAQAYAADVLPGVGESAIQVFGGIGFTWEHDAHLFYERLLSSSALFGNADAHYAELSRLVLD